MRIIANLLVATILMAAYTINVQAQVSNDNEDEVYKVERPQAKDFVPGQVLFKLKDGQQAKVRRAAGRVQSAGNSSLDKVLKEYAVQEMEQLLPNAKVTGTPRRAKAFNGDAIVERDLTQLYKVALPEEQSDRTMELVEQLQSLNEVEFAEPNYKLYIMADDHIADSYSSNPMVGQQWYLDAYGVKELWDKPMINKTRPVIAIIDTGVDITHPDLKDNIWTNQAEVDGRDDYDNDRNGFKNDIHGWDFINNTPTMRDNNKHGTHVAGIAAAANNGVGIVGANPQAWIMPITVMQSDGTGDVATIVKGIDYAVKNGATVINMSIGTYANSSALRQALEKAYQSVVIVAAAGNDGKCIYASHYPYPHKKPVPMPCFPGAYSFVFGVQATSSGGTLAPFSNYDDDGPLFSCESTAQDPDGFNYELKAPGVGILSTIPGGGYQQLSGTSMATPLVAGSISALMMVKQYDNQEILWGELLHSDNIAQTYQMKNRPADLDIMKVMLRERKELVEETDEDYKKNNEVNTGEVVSIYPVVRTTFGSASNIKLRLIVPAGVELINGEIVFGYNLSAFGKGVSKNPLIIKVPNDMPNASIIDLTVVATCNESEESFSNSFKLKVCNMRTLKGLLTEDVTLTADNVYYVIDDVGINEGVTMTIEPGTRVEFAEGTGLYGFGKIIANGTPEKPIVLTGHNGKIWNGIYSHESTGIISHEKYADIYTNNDRTLFTLLPTEETPNIFSYKAKQIYYDPSNENTPPQKNFYLTDYVEDWNPDFTRREELLTDPNYITTAVLTMLNDWDEYCEQFPSSGNYFIAWMGFAEWYYYENPTDMISYCRVDGASKLNQNYTEPLFKDCIVNCCQYKTYGTFYYVSGVRNVLTSPNYSLAKNLTYSNIVNDGAFIYSSQIGRNNIVNTDPYWKEAYLPPSYLGTGREDIARSRIRQAYSGSDFWDKIDLSQMAKEPYPEAHGIVWKVLVNGTDPQDEFEGMLPLGVGKHKFDVYFNRPMNKNVIPQISFGMISPYNQHPVADEGSWNADGTIYTANVTIDGKTRSDGMNRIYVRDAEDNEFFPCPYEATRFNIMVQAAGSMASGFQADAGLGCVNLKWNNENNDFEDAMGFNVYRYTEGEGGVNDTIRINEDILDITATSYIDDNVVPGQTYYYYYKVLSTALQEYDVSNVVAATPLTATRGDANGSGEVDVADVITTVNYVTGLQPKPFVFDAADMNNDQMIDIFDVVGIVRGILNPSLLNTASLNEESAIYSIENGTLYVDSPVALAGIQVQLDVVEGQEIYTAEDLDGFETASAWLSNTDYLFIAYSMSGKSLTPGRHALLHIGVAKLTSLRLSDAAGHNISVTEKGGETTGMDSFRRNVVSSRGVFDLSGRKVTVSDKQESLPHGVYIIDGKKVVK